MGVIHVVVSGIANQALIGSCHCRFSLMNVLQRVSVTTVKNLFQLTKKAKTKVIVHAGGKVLIAIIFSQQQQIPVLQTAKGRHCTVPEIHRRSTRIVKPKAIDICGIHPVVHGTDQRVLHG